jgi:hypothetical protein
MVRRYLSCGRRGEGKGRIRITRRGKIAGSRPDKRLAEKALYAKSKIKLTLTFLRRTTAAGSDVRVFLRLEMCKMRFNETCS